MRCACIDIGSNTTALLVADTGDDGLNKVGSRRAFTLLGANLRNGLIGPEKIDEVCDAAAIFVEYARQMGADQISVVATHVVREAANAEALKAIVEHRCGLPVRVLDTEEEARYSFCGAVGGRTAPDRPTVVIDGGGGSTEVSWSRGDAQDVHTRSFAIGSSSLREKFFEHDPPTKDELVAARKFADETFSVLDVPEDCMIALAVGGGATTARELVGGLIDDASVTRVLNMIAKMDSEEVSERLEIEWQRALLLPASLTILAALSEKLGLSLEVGMGGLREGVIHELAQTA
ncbi:MAG: hypothetical protein HY827_07635 [Actinobacteria bacterium]|nr:hypothetical protein [Actinomycetota bacterium]